MVMVLLAAGLFVSRSVFGVSQLIQDGGFESPLGGSGPWQLSGTLSGISFANSPGGGVNGSSGFLSMGNNGGTTTQQVFQPVNIPTNALLLQVGYFWSLASTDSPNGALQFTSSINDTNGNQLVLLDSENSQFQVAIPYTQFGLVSISGVTNIAGQTVDLLFQAVLPVAGVGFHTSLNIDNVNLIAWTTADIPPNDNFANATDLNGASKITVVATNVVASKEPGEPNIAGGVGGHSVWWKWTAPANGVVTVNTKGSTFATLLEAFTGSALTNLSPVAGNNSGGTDSQIKFPVSTGTTYHIAIDGKGGATGLAQLNLAFALDTTPPKVTITSPAAGAKLTNSTVTVKGTASDNVAVAFVQYRLENADGTNDYQDANGSNAWNAMVTGLIPGLNTIRVRAFDTSSNVSAAAARTVNFIVPSPLTLITNGIGAISPNLNGQLLDVNANYKFVAKPGPGQVLSNWVDGDGNVLGTTPVVIVTMQSNLVLTANFVPNPFIPVIGVYQGLFFDTNGPEHQSSGFYNLALASSGAFSAKVIIAGKSYSYTGQFSAGGFASNNIVRKGLPSVSAQLQLDLLGGGISGVLNSPPPGEAVPGAMRSVVEFLPEVPWTAELNADRAMTNAAADAGRYTLVIPGADDDSNSVAQPGGDSYGALIVSATGGLNFSGALADNTAVSQKTLLLANGQWPFYVPLYTGKGSIFGWLTFSNQADSDITGTVDWFKPAQAVRFYPAGFTNSTQATGSIYQFTNTVPVLGFSNGVVWFANGNIPNDFTNQVSLGTNNVVSNLTTNNALTLKLTASTGLFKVTAVDPDTHKTVTGSGVVLQKQNFGDGFFPGTNQVGQLFWGPAGP